MHPTRGTRIHLKGLQSPLEGGPHPTGTQGQIRAPFAGTIYSTSLLRPLLFEHGREALNRVRGSGMLGSPYAQPPAGIAGGQRVRGEAEELAGRAGEFGTAHDHRLVPALLSVHHVPSKKEQPSGQPPLVAWRLTFSRTVDPTTPRQARKFSRFHAMSPSVDSCRSTTARRT